MTIRSNESEVDVLCKAVQALEEFENLRQATRANGVILLRLCREYDAASGCIGVQVHHLRQACVARGLIVPEAA